MRRHSEGQLYLIQHVDYLSPRITGIRVAHRNHRTHRIANRFALAPSRWKAHANYFLTSRKGAKIRKVYSSHLSTLIFQLLTLIFNRSTFTSELQNLRTSHLLWTLIFQRSSFNVLLLFAPLCVFAWVNRAERSVWASNHYLQRDAPTGQQHQAQGKWPKGTAPWVEWYTEWRLERAKANY